MYKFQSVDEYIETFSSEIQEKLNLIRETIKKIVPNAQEVISYNMPAFKYNGILVYYAAYKNHIGFYPSSSGIANFQDEFKEYKWSKGAVQFPHDKPLPIKLIMKIVKFRINENSEKLLNKITKK